MWCVNEPHTYKDDLIKVQLNHNRNKENQMLWNKQINEQDKNNGIDDAEPANQIKMYKHKGNFITIHKLK